MTKKHWCPNAWNDIRCGKTVYYNYNRSSKARAYTCESCGANYDLQGLSECNRVTSQLSQRKRRQEYVDKYGYDVRLGVEESLTDQ